MKYGVESRQGSFQREVSKTPSNQSTSQAEHDLKILTTLAEKDYFLGVSALINSVVANGCYVDKVVVGYRGDLPQWLPKLSESRNGLSAQLCSGLQIEFVQVQGDLHMVHEKPKWFKHLTATLEPNADEYFFFDSDIIVIKRMSFFGEWVKQGVGLCEDVNYDMAANNPIRLRWAKEAESAGLKIINPNASRYYNSGFLAWTKETSAFLDDWITSFNTLAPIAADTKKFRTADRTHPVFSANQDSLNLATMITSVPLSTLGPGAMQFDWTFPLMVHPIGPKPWKRSFIKEFLKGRPPRSGDMAFWRNVVGSELAPFSRNKALVIYRLCSVLRGLSRFYSK